MARVAYIGAGSTGFGKRLASEILTQPGLADSTLSLMDISQENLDVIAALTKKMAAQLGSTVKVEATTDRRKALEGADYVISTAENPGGSEAHISVQRISDKYGVRQAIGCTSGLGGVFRALRFIPFMLDLCHDMEELCPRAWLLHYANPTSTVPWALTVASPVRSIGLCHSVQGTAAQLAGYIGAPYEETGHWAAGVNHQAWMLRFEWQGRDAYPLLFEKMQDPAVYQRDIVRFELMKHFGYFPTESSAHNGEYVPYFRKNLELIERYCPGCETAVNHLEREKTGRATAREARREEALSDQPVDIHMSQEYCIGIINAMETNEPFRFNGNVLNSGLITNLPPGSCVEVPCLVDNMGVHPCHVGALPPQCAALNANRIAGDGLAVKAALEGDRKAAEQAVALDPLTAAICTLDQIHDMVTEAFAALAEWLPQFLCT